MNFNKRVNGSWVDTPNYIHNTSTNTLTTVPADIYANDTTATVGLKGNMSQTGTPTPDNPIQPSECGEKSSNLYNVSDKSATINSSVTLVDLGVDTTFDTITISCMFDNLVTTSVNGVFLDFLKDDSTHQYVAPSNMYNVTDDTPIIANTITTGNYYTTKNNLTFRYIKAYLYSTAYNRFQSGTIKWAFYDSEKKDYEPYGYKIPISSTSTTTPVYLSEVETTRKIKKLVLDGTENWSKFESGGKVSFYVNVPYGTGTACLSTHFINSGQSGFPSYNGVLYNGNLNKNMLFRMSDDTTITDVASFKSYLAAQYTNGTPVTVWYILETEETGIVNEPLCKIGDYADTVSGVTIPVIAGANTLTVDTTLQPSEVTVNYKGWHTVADVHEHNNGAQT